VPLRVLVVRRSSRHPCGEWGPPCEEVSNVAVLQIVLRRVDPGAGRDGSSARGDNNFLGMCVRLHPARRARMCGSEPVYVCVCVCA
jgi:hypothetical protein